MSVEIDFCEYSSDALARLAYVGNDTANLQSYSEDTIKTQGSYSLKGIAAITDSLNDTLTKTFPKPISHWKMNDNLATTNVIDSVGDNDGTAAQNTDQLDTTGKINGALTFNGTADVVSCGSTGFPDAAEDRTICLWIYPDSIVDAWGGIFWYGTASANNGFAITWNASTQYIIIGKYGANS